MTSDVQEIFSRFRVRVEDYKLAGMKVELAEEKLFGYLDAVISNPDVRRLYSKIKLDRDIGEVEYAMRNSWDSDADASFTDEMLALGMVCEWAAPLYFSTLNASQLFTTKEQSSFSQATHMNAVKAMYLQAETKFQKYLCSRGYSQEYVASLT